MAADTTANPAGEMLLPGLTFRAGRGIYMLVVAVSSGFEHAIAELIHDVYGSSILGLIPGFGCIVILVKTQKHGLTISNSLKGLRPKKKG